MSNQSPLHPIVHARFKNAFGEPHRTMGKDWHWALRPLANIATINVLVNGSSEFPVVWVFDPHDPKDGVINVAIKDDDGQLDQIIRDIEARVKHAVRPSQK